MRRLADLTAPQLIECTRQQRRYPFLSFLELALLGSMCIGNQVFTKVHQYRKEMKE